VIAAIHCGWRGTQRRIAEQTIQKLREHYNCDPSSLLAALGPCIGPACYEVGQDVRTSFRDSDLPDDIFERHSEHKDKYHLDLRAANRRQLVHQGLGEENIFDIDICTHCDPEFHSYRRDKNDVGRLFNFIGVRS
jgi:YfiH family protein